MKKTALLTAAALSAGMIFSSCGLTKDDDESDKGKSKDYKEIVEDYFDSFKGSDIQELLKRVYPDNLAEMTYRYGDFDYIKELLDKDVELISVEKGDDLSKEDITQLATYLGKMKYPFDLLDEYGLESVDDIENMDEDKLEEMQKKYSEFNWDEYQSPYDIDEAYLVKVKYKYDDAEKDNEMLVYHIDDEGWKIAEDLWRYIKKYQKTSLDVSASSLYKAYWSALMDLENKDDADISGTYIICSDSSKNVNVPESIDVDKLEGYVKNYFDKADDFDYFVVIEDGCTVFSAAAEKNERSKLGTYPMDCIPCKEDDHISTDSSSGKDYDFDEIYTLASDLLK